MVLLASPNPTGEKIMNCQDCRWLQYSHNMVVCSLFRVQLTGEPILCMGFMKKTAEEPKTEELKG